MIHYYGIKVLLENSIYKNLKFIRKKKIIIKKDTKEKYNYVPIWIELYQLMGPWININTHMTHEKAFNDIIINTKI